MSHASFCWLLFAYRSTENDNKLSTRWRIRLHQVVHKVGGFVIEPLFKIICIFRFVDGQFMIINFESLSMSVPIVTEFPGDQLFWEIWGCCLPAFLIVSSDSERRLVKYLIINVDSPKTALNSCFCGRCWAWIRSIIARRFCSIMG